MIEPALAQSLTWRKAEKGWRLFAGKRSFGDVLPDSKYPGMWRTPLSGGRLSDMANLSWARNAVLEAALRELAYEARPIQLPSNSQQTGAVFLASAPYSDLTRREVSDMRAAPTINASESGSLTALSS